MVLYTTVRLLSVIGTASAFSTPAANGCLPVAQATVTRASCTALPPVRRAAALQQPHAHAPRGKRRAVG